MDVRTLQPTDFDELWPMLQAMGSSGTSSEAERRFLSLLADQRWLLIGCPGVGGQLVGYAAVQDRGPHLRSGDLHRTARLHDLFVLPVVRRQGFGRVLMEAVVGWADGRVRYLEWQAHETRAAPFYQRLGYTGEPCPQPDYPTFEVTFDAPGP